MSSKNEKMTRVGKILPGGILLSGRDLEALDHYCSKGFYNHTLEVLQKLNMESIVNCYMAYTNNSRINQIIKIFEEFILDFKAGKVSGGKVLGELLKMKRFIDFSRLYPEFCELFYILYERSQVTESSGVEIQDVYMQLATILFGRHTPIYIDSLTGVLKINNEGEEFAW